MPSTGIMRGSICTQQQRHHSLTLPTGRARELALTARTFGGAEALQMGLVTHVFSDEAALQARCMQEP